MSQPTKHILNPELEELNKELSGPIIKITKRDEKLKAEFDKDPSFKDKIHNLLIEKVKRDNEFTDQLLDMTPEGLQREMLYEDHEETYLAETASYYVKLAYYAGLTIPAADY